MMRLLTLGLSALFLAGCTATTSIPSTLLLQTQDSLTRIQDGRAKGLPLPAGVTDLAPSPDGRFLLGKQGGQWVYFTVGQTETHPLSDAASAKHKWSPSGNLIAVTNGGTLRILDLMDRAKTAYEVTLQTDIHDLSWSPDQAYLAIAAGEWNQTSELLLLHIESGEVTSLGPVPFYPLPRWSPDSQRLVFHTQDREHENAAVIYTIGEGTLSPLLSRSRLYELIEDPALHHLNDHILGLAQVQWAPDGEWLAFSYKAGGKDRRFVAGAIRKDGQAAHTLVLPLHADKAPTYISPPLPCNPFSDFTWRDDGVLLRLNGPGCETDLVLLAWPTLQVQQTWTMPNPAQGEQLLLAPDGSLALSAGWETAIVPLREGVTVPTVTLEGRPLGWFPGPR